MSSFVHRVCYNQAKSYMLIKLQETRYRYCAIDAGTVSALKSASSLGRHY